MRDQIDENKRKIIERLKELRLDKRQIDRVVNKLRAFADRIEKGEQEILEMVEKTSPALAGTEKGPAEIQAGRAGPVADPGHRA